MNKRAEAQPTAQKRSPDSTGENLIAGDVPSQIRDALTTAKNLTGARQQTDRLRALRAQRSPVVQANLQAERLLASAFGKSDFDTEKFKAIQAESRAELRRILQAQQAEAVKHSADAKATFRGAIESRRKVIERALASPVTEGISPFFQEVVLDAPFLIWPSTGSSDLFFDNYQIEPWNSWAKFKVDSTSEVAGAGIDFYFFWENASKNSVLINVDSWLMLNGYGRIDFPEHWNWEYSLIKIAAYLSLLEWWNQPPTGPASQAGQVEQVLEISDYFSGGPIFTFMPQPFAQPVAATWWGHGWGEGVSQSHNLRYNLELVPPGGQVVIKVGPDISWINHGGAGIEADFDSGNFEVICPFVQIQIMRPGPLTIKPR